MEKTGIRRILGLFLFHIQILSEKTSKNVPKLFLESSQKIF